MIISFVDINRVIHEFIQFVIFPKNIKTITITKTLYCIPISAFYKILK